MSYELIFVKKSVFVCFFLSCCLKNVTVRANIQFYWMRVLANLV